MGRIGVSERAVFFLGETVDLSRWESDQAMTIIAARNHFYSLLTPRIRFVCCDVCNIVS